MLPLGEKPRFVRAAEVNNEYLFIDFIRSSYMLCSPFYLRGFIQ